MGGNNCCSYAFITDDLSRHILYLEAVCHAKVWNFGCGNGQDFSPDRIITSAVVQDDIDLQYYIMLLNGPFKRYANFFRLLQHTTGDYYFEISGLDVLPPQLVYNFIIATRGALEWRHYWFKDWSALCKAGVPTLFAFILATNKLDHTDPNPLMWTFEHLSGSDWHFWFDPNASWTALVNSRPKITQGVCYKNDTYGCVPCSAIWGNVCFSDFDWMIGKTVQHISHQYGYVPMPNPDFPSYEGTTYERESEYP